MAQEEYGVDVQDEESVRRYLDGEVSANRGAAGAASSAPGVVEVAASGVALPKCKSCALWALKEHTLAIVGAI